MVDQDASLDRTFHALADPTRRAMLEALAGGRRTVSALAAPHSMTLARASKHVRVLEGAGLIRRTVEGPAHLPALTAEPMGRTQVCLAHYQAFWSPPPHSLEPLPEGQTAPKA